MAGKPDTRELAHEAIGSARLTAFGVSNFARAKGSSRGRFPAAIPRSRPSVHSAPVPR
jgi:hypothetical protein